MWRTHLDAPGPHVGGYERIMCSTVVFGSDFDERPSHRETIYSEGQSSLSLRQGSPFSNTLPDLQSALASRKSLKTTFTKARLDFFWKWPLVWCTRIAVVRKLRFKCGFYKTCLKPTRKRNKTVDKQQNEVHKTYVFCLFCFQTYCRWVVGDRCENSFKTNAIRGRSGWNYKH